MTTINKYGGLSRILDFELIYSGKNILLVTGKKSFESSGAKQTLSERLLSQNIFQFSEFAVNPKIEDAIRGAKFAREHNIDAIIAVGGGSVLDMAKLIKAFFLSEGNEAELVTGKKAVEDPNIPFIAIPTTSGSGSEATHFAVVYYEKNKYSLASKYLLPDAVILDGSITLSANQYLKKCNALDAMAQAIESYWAINSTTQSQKYAIEAIELGWKVLLQLNSKNYKKVDAQNMIEAANLAGKAINISKTTAAHAWSYAFTSGYKVPHGHAVWLTLPSIFKLHFLHAKSNSGRSTINQELFHKMKNLCSILDLDTAEDIEVQLNDLLHRIGMEHRMEHLGLDTVIKRKAVANQVNMERLKNNPINLEKYQDKIFRL